MQHAWHDMLAMSSQGAWRSSALLAAWCADIAMGAIGWARAMPVLITIKAMIANKAAIRFMLELRFLRQKGYRIQISPASGLDGSA